MKWQGPKISSIAWLPFKEKKLEDPFCRLLSSDYLCFSQSQANKEKKQAFCHIIRKPSREEELLALIFATSYNGLRESVFDVSSSTVFDVFNRDSAIAERHASLVLQPSWCLCPTLRFSAGRSSLLFPDFCFGVSVKNEWQKNRTISVHNNSLAVSNWLKALYLYFLFSKIIFISG